MIATMATAYRCRKDKVVELPHVGGPRNLVNRDPGLALQSLTFPKNPCMLVIYPTKALEEDMVCIVSRLDFF